MFYFLIIAKPGLMKVDEEEEISPIVEETMIMIEAKEVIKDRSKETMVLMEIGLEMILLLQKVPIRFRIIALLNLKEERMIPMVVLVNHGKGHLFNQPNKTIQGLIILVDLSCN